MSDNDLQLADSAAEREAPIPTRRRGLRRAFRPQFGTSMGSTSQGGIPEPGLTEPSRRRDATYRRLLGVADVSSAAIAIGVGVPLLGDDAVNPLALLAIPFVVLVAKVSGLYERDEYVLRKDTIEEIPALLQVATLYAFLMFIAGNGIVEGEFGRDQALGVWGLLFASMLFTRSLARRLARCISASERCVVLGDAGEGDFIAQKLACGTCIKAEVVGRVPLQPDPPGANGLPILGDRQSLPAVLAAGDVDRVVIAPNGSMGEDILSVIRQVKALGVKVSVVPRLFEVVGSSVEFDDLDGMTLLGVRRHGLSRSSSILKRAFDLASAGVGVLILAPLLAMIAVAIKLDSRGPVFFRQLRMGRNDTPFAMLKFRTMVAEAETKRSELQARNEAGDGLFKIEDDPRITRVGGFLRRTSLDELPQLFNVLRGDMSLVGPRPLVIDEDAMIEGWQRRRLLLPPGMTGMWQVFGSARIPLPEMVKIDYLYGANWSLWLDVKILLRTVGFVVGRRGL
jgi:exopolysaccharide biosynthesis polyprenyl glycosylphosphotransferase